ncbi:MAG: hypothetical protein J0I01_14320 [Stenotrophomonas nitritireducens]|nr:hypothetical protein [Stenotrophomonas nitritireducens]MBN8769364.1 hypothetical protein [Stenotrophomonas sp.]MBN8793397.1 hypothetical protein [Stenotrophomonas nitritireducens]
MDPLANLNPLMFGRAYKAERRALGKGLLIADAHPDLDRLHLLADPDDES